MISIDFVMVMWIRIQNEGDKDYIVKKIRGLRTFL